MHQGRTEWVGYAMQRVPEGSEMNDKELLNLAAKAAEISADYWTVDGWNPLYDDGDALFLAVNLGINISFPPYMKHERPVVHAGKYWDNSDDCWYPFEELLDINPHAATCRAIVKAAAQIGREMK
jgi:hypothetical protein